MKQPRPIVFREPPDANVFSTLSGLDPVLAQLFMARGVSAASELDYSLTGLAPVSSLEHIAAAVDLLLEHKDRRIIIVGDFDVDGATSTALLMRCFRAFGFQDVDYIVPNRFLVMAFRRR